MQATCISHTLWKKVLYVKFKSVQSCGGNGGLGQLILFPKRPPSPDAAVQVHVPWVATSLECPRSSVGKSRITQDCISLCVLSWIFDIFVLSSLDFCEVEKYILWYSIASANIKHLEVDDTLPTPFLPLPSNSEHGLTGQCFTTFTQQPRVTGYRDMTWDHEQLLRDCIYLPVNTCLLFGHSISINNGNNNSDNSFYMLHMQGIVQSLAYFSYKISSMKTEIFACFIHSDWHLIHRRQSVNIFECNLLLFHHDCLK